MVVTLLPIEMVNREVKLQVIAAQSIGEPGTQLTLHCPRAGGVGVTFLKKTQLSLRMDSILEIEDNKTARGESSDGKEVE
jgi:DNA-directed RNA polymerase subunit beta'